MEKSEKLENLKKLLSHLLEKAEQEDLIHKKKSLESNKASEAIGESFWVFHLKEARQLLNDIER
tara:strand:+ start:152 stop:343 length:192 start_codon:yes stop_codon:yes gene_type:complete